MKKCIIIFITTSVLYASPDVTDLLTNNSSIISFGMSGALNIDYNGTSYQYRGINVSLRGGYSKFVNSLIALGYSGYISFSQENYFGINNIYLYLNNNFSSSFYFSTNNIIPYISIDLGIDLIYSIQPIPQYFNVSLGVNTRYGLLFQLKDKLYFDLYIIIPIPIYITIFSTSYFQLVNFTSLRIPLGIGLTYYY